jgi:hypothetical protein
MDCDSRQDAEWRLAVAQERLEETEAQLERERLRRLRLEEQEVVVVDHLGESHRFYPNQGTVTDSEWDYSDVSESDTDFDR